MRFTLISGHRPQSGSCSASSFHGAKLSIKRGGLRTPRFGSAAPQASSTHQNSQIVPKELAQDETLASPERSTVAVPSLQAEVFWLREQLDRERSKSNTAPAETRRLALETAQKQREVVNLQGQVTSLRQHLLEAEASLHSQEADLALCRRAQLQDDWTRYAATRKRLLNSMAQTDKANSKANRTERALKQEQQLRADLEARLTNLQHKLQVNAEEAAAAKAAAAEAAAKLGPTFMIAPDTPLLGSLLNLRALVAGAGEPFSQLFASAKGPSD